MDKHIQVLRGRTIEFDYDFCDENLHDISWFCEKHIGYAAREAAVLLDIELNLTGEAGIEKTKRLEYKQCQSAKRSRYMPRNLYFGVRLPTSFTDTLFVEFGAMEKVGLFLPLFKVAGIELWWMQ